MKDMERMEKKERMESTHTHVTLTWEARFGENTVYPRRREREEEHLESMPKIAFRCYFSDVTIDTCSSLTQLRVLQVMLCSLTQCSSPEKNVVFLTAFLLPHHLLFRDDPFLSCFPCNSCHAFQVVFYSSNHKISRRNSSVSFFFCRKHCKTEQSSTTSL